MGLVWNSWRPRSPGCSDPVRALREKTSMAPFLPVLDAPGSAHCCRTVAQSPETRLDSAIPGSPLLTELTPHWPEDPISGSTLPELEFRVLYRHGTFG